MSSGAEEIPPGTVLAGKYRVERVLGKGGMGVVVAAHHEQLDEKVALKFLLPGTLDNTEATARFLREARAAVKIKNEHVARTIDVGQLDDGAPYIVMEYLEGADLATWLHQHGPMPVERAVDFVLQACEALADAHALGIVHRDLKPANLFCVQRSDGRAFIKVLDFGISKVTTPGGPANDMTRTNALIGSPLYMSPEQMQVSKGVDARTDVWALGVILFELVTGRPPFQAEAVTELAIKVATHPAPALRAVRPDAPARLESAIARCLEKERARRFQSVAELAMALGEIAPPSARASVDRVVATLRNASVPLSPLASSGDVALASAPTLAAGVPLTASSWGATSDRKGGSRVRSGAPLFAFGLIALSLAAGAGVFALRRPPQGVPSSVATAGSATVPSGALDAAPVALAVPSSPPAVPAAPAPVAAPPSAAPVASSASPPNARTAPRPSRAPAAVPAAPAPSASARKPSCDPPYVIDSAGYRQYKPECL